ncbi:MAG: RNA-binding protein hfq [Cyanobacteria bacterium SID2]|nr:RNA-binding protein hfq [Cyanobacteria bacterium SID2]MBP0003843.1 RNA-binding protein hfq [Cyanobacteria bacterium SBC]
MAIEFDTSLPSIRIFQAYVQEKTHLEVQLTTGDRIQGRLLWQDPVYLCFSDDNNQQYFINRNGLVYLRPLAPAASES